MTAVSRTEAVANIVTCETVVSFQTSSYHEDVKTCPSFCSAHPSLPSSLPPSAILFSPSPSIPHCPVSSPPCALHHRVPHPLSVHPPVLNKQTSSGWLVSPIYNSSQTNYSGDVCQTQENTSPPTSERGGVKKRNLVVPQIQHTERTCPTFSPQI